VDFFATFATGHELGSLSSPESELTACPPEHDGSDGQAAEHDHDLFLQGSKNASGEKKRKSRKE
jgi:hypothetical protein